MLAPALCLLFVFCLSKVKGDSVILQEQYSKQTYVTIDELQKETCLISSKRNKIQCATQCSISKTCLGFLWSKDKTCLIHDFIDCSPKSVQQNGEKSVYYRKKIVNCNGNWDYKTNKCKCTGGFIGPPTCVEYGKSCRDVHNDGSYVHLGKEVATVFPLKPFGKDPRPVTCTFKSKSAIITVALKTNYNKQQDINRFENKKFDEYVSGFKYPNEADGEDLWLGLDLLHHFTREKKLVMEIIIRSGYNKRRYLFEDFKVNGQDEGYSASARLVQSKNINGTRWQRRFGQLLIDDCLGNGISTPFSVPNQQNNINYGIQCTYKMKSPWWYPECNALPVCNPLGEFYRCNDIQSNDPNYIRMYGFDENQACDIDYVWMYLKEPI